MAKKMKPCKEHRFAAFRFKTPEVVAMREQGVKFRLCKRCGWVIKKPHTDGSMIQEILNYGMKTKIGRTEHIKLKKE